MADAPSTIVTTPEQERLRAEVRELCARFPDEYWRERDRAREYPDAFVDALTEAGYLAVLIPTEYGGGGLGITEGSIVLEEINRSGGHSAGCHAQMYTMGALLKHGSRRAEADLSAGDRGRESAAAGVLDHRARGRVGHHRHRHHRDAGRR